MKRKDIAMLLIGAAIGMLIIIWLVSLAPFYSFTWTYWVARFFLVVSAAGSIFLLVRK